MNRIPSRSAAPSVDPGFDVEIHEDDVLDLSPIQKIWRSVWLKRYTVAGIIGAGIMLALVFTLVTTPEYTSSARLQISRLSSNVSNVDGVEPELQSLDYDEFYQTQYALLKSTTLAERVARSLNLASDPRFLEAFGVNTEDGEPKVEDLGSILLDNLSISPVRGSSLVDVQFTSPVPVLSTRIADEWVRQFVAVSLERRFSATNDARDFLQNRLVQLRERLEDSERQLVAYASNTGIFAIADSSEGASASSGETLIGNDLGAINVVLSQARADRIGLESQLNTRTNGTRNELADSLRARRAELASERAKLLTQFEEGYPQVQALAAQISELDRGIVSAESQSVTLLRQQYQAAVQREKGLERQLNALKGDYLNEQKATIQYNILRREVDTNRQLYDGLLQRYKEIGIAGGDASNVVLIDNPKVPRIPSSPNLPLNILVGLMLGTAMAGAFLFVHEQIDRSLHDPEDVKRILRIPVLGGIPACAPDRIGEDLLDTKTEISEAYLSVVTMLDFSTEDGAPATVMITSTGPNEGKTSSSFAIANQLARRGKRVVLVDTDLRNPSIAGFVGIPGSNGVSDFLSGNAELAALVQADVRPNLAILPAGMVPPNPGELLSNRRFDDLLSQLQQQYDHVIVDAPPVLGIADAPFISSKVEGVVFVIEANRARLRQLASALERLRNMKAKIIGAVVTKLDERNQAYGFGREHGYGYGYGQAEASQPKYSRKSHGGIA